MLQSLSNVQVVTKSTQKNHHQNISEPTEQQHISEPLFDHVFNQKQIMYEMKQILWMFIILSLQYTLPITMQFFTQNK